MIEIVGVRLRENGKVYYFDAQGTEYNVGDKVVVKTLIGIDIGTVIIDNRLLDDTKTKRKYDVVLRKATEEDLVRDQQNKEEAKKAYDICKKKIKEHKLDMKLVETRYLFDRSKLIVYFTSEDRVDFRALVKDLANVFKIRIELRQISIRDQVKRIGGLGVCGRELCCCTLGQQFQQLSIKMAKDQNLSLNASKITGNCGRLKCCLKYEEEVYKEKADKLPHVGAVVQTDEGQGTVESVEVYREIIRVKLKDEEEDDYYFKKYNSDEITIIKDNKKKGFKEQSKEELEELQKLEKIESEKETSEDDM